MYLAPSTNYPVSIGAGGAAASSGTKQENGYCGNASYFNNIVANGGGAAGSYVYRQKTGRELKGGSGGGKGTRISVSGSANEGGDGLTGQGYAGGASSGTYSSSGGASGGGGGAGAAGGDANASTYVGGDGGDGVQTSITGTATYFAGGGGGTGGGTGGAGSGGQGGGADGTRNAAGNSGTANTGGGAGGIIVFGTHQLYGGNGGSGIVILRYPNTYTISQSGLTLSTATTGSDKVTTITAGTGTISFS